MPDPGKLAIRIQRESLELLLRNAPPEKMRTAKIVTSVAQGELLHQRLTYAAKTLRWLEDNEATVKAAIGGNGEEKSST